MLLDEPFSEIDQLNLKKIEYEIVNDNENRYLIISHDISTYLKNNLNIIEL